jgi:hypothetical protein
LVRQVVKLRDDKKKAELAKKKADLALDRACLESKHNRENFLKIRRTLRDQEIRTQRRLFRESRRMLNCVKV